MPLCALALSALWATAGAAFVPSNVRLSLTDQSLSIIDGEGRMLSTATICPGFVFDQFGPRGPHLSPDLHWVLVDIKGPFAPGNVQRNYALVYVPSGKVITAPDFPHYVGVPSATDDVSWASGERATLRYKNGMTAVPRDPPLAPVPAPRCASPAPGQR